MLYSYKALTKSGEEREGSIDAVNEDVAVSSLQRRGLIVVSVKPAGEESWFEKDLNIFSGVSSKDLVILSRQIATLFEAQVSALRVFRLLSEETDNKTLRSALGAVADDIQGGMSISEALAKHPSVFSDFYVNMVRAGEETAKLNETFQFLADHLEQNHELISKTRGALMYPAFVIVVFIVVMILMFTMVIPRLSEILVDSGQELPIYTKAVIGISNFLVNYGLFLAGAIVIAGVVGWYYHRQGAFSFSEIQLKIPGINTLLKQVYLARMAGNMHTMLASGVPMVRSIEITSTVVGNEVYKQMLDEAAEAVRAGSPLSEALEHYELMPNILVQMVKVGEETGELASILEKMSKFYRREVYTAIDTFVSLIEPIMIVVLGLGVGLILVSVLMPIYNIAGSI